MLTAKQIPVLPDGFYALGDCPCGYVRVRGAARVFNFKYQLDGRVREMTVGRFPVMTLAQARDCIRGLRAQVKAGGDPMAAKREEVVRRATASTTFAACAEMYRARNAGQWGASHARWVESTLRRQINPAIGNKPVVEIDKNTCVRLLQPLFDTLKTADRIRCVVEEVLDTAAVADFRTGDNPARWRGCLQKLINVTVAPDEHHDAVPYDRAPTFVAAMRGLSDAGYRTLIRPPMRLKCSCCAPVATTRSG